jgi:hypothetical protein
VFPRGEVNWIHGMAVDPDGSLYFAEVQGRKAQKFVRVGAETTF